MSGRPPVIVIGAGIAGLTAAALLQRRGAEVTLLEAHALPGGCAGWFRRGAFQYAVGATISTGFEPGGLHARVYAELGLEARFRALEFCYDVVLGDRRLRVWNDRVRWRHELLAHFPASKHAIDRFWDRVEAVASATKLASSGLPAMPVEGARDLIDLARAGLTRLGAARALPYFGRTVDDELERAGLRDADHRTLCRAQILDAMQSETDRCPFPNGALALDIYRHGAQYVEGGMGRIARDLLTCFVKDGGRALFRTPAAAIEFDGVRVAGVRDERGQVYRGQVLSALPGDATQKLLPAELRSTLAERARRAETAWGACTLYLAVDERALPRDHPPFVMAVPDPARPLHDGNSIFISTSPDWDRTRAPAGMRAITISTHTEAAPWWSLSEADYATRREAVVAEMLQAAERAVPGLNSGILHALPGTPRTFERFTRRPLGRVGGVPQTLETANFRALSHRGEWPGLWHAGDCVFPGQGAVGVTLGALVAARSIGRATGLPGSAG